MFFLLFNFCYSERLGVVLCWFFRLLFSFFVCLSFLSYILFFFVCVFGSRPSFCTICAFWGRSVLFGSFFVLIITDNPLVQAKITKTKNSVEPSFDHLTVKKTNTCKHNIQNGQNNMKQSLVRSRCCFLFSSKNVK